MKFPGKAGENIEVAILRKKMLAEARKFHQSAGDVKRIPDNNTETVDGIPLADKKETVR